jgi:hypothetical protein
MYFKKTHIRLKRVNVSKVFGFETEPSPLWQWPIQGRAGLGGDTGRDRPKNSGLAHGVVSVGVALPVEIRSFL